MHITVHVLTPMPIYMETKAAFSIYSSVVLPIYYINTGCVTKPGAQ